MKNKESDKAMELDRELKFCHKRLDSFGKELKNLVSEINTISEWIYERFGVNLTEKSNCHLKDNRGDVNCEETEVRENIQLGYKDSPINSSARSDRDKTKFSTVSRKEMKLSNVSDSDISSPDFYEDDVANIDTSKKRKCRPKLIHVHAPTHNAAQVIDSINQVPKRGRPKKKESSNIVNIITTPIKCDMCGKMLKDAGSLRQHKLIHKNIKPHPCPECGKCFKRKFHLKTHSLIHAGVKKHQCGYCGKLFLLPKDLIAHERTHTGEKPFSCNVCPKSFNLKSHLVMHLRTHTGEKPYRCEICEKYFSQSNSLRVHKKVHQKPRNTTKSSVQRQHRPKQETSSIPAVYSIPNSVARPLQNSINPSNNMEADPLSSQSSLSSSTVNIPMSNLVSFDIVPMSASVSQHQHESHNVIHQNIIKIESNNLTVQDVLQLQPEMSTPVEIINLSHVNIEHIIGSENNVHKNVGQPSDNIEKESYNTGNGVGGSYFF